MARDIGAPSTIPSAMAALGHVAFDQGDLDSAVSCFREILDASRARGNQAQLIDALEGLARTGAARGSPVSTVRVLGAASTLREAIGIGRTASELTYFEPIVAKLRNATGKIPSTMRGNPEGYSGWRTQLPKLSRLWNDPSPHPHSASPRARSRFLTSSLRDIAIARSATSSSSANPPPPATSRTSSPNSTSIPALRQSPLPTGMAFSHRSRRWRFCRRPLHS